MSDQDEINEPIRKRGQLPKQYRLTHLLYVTALIASSYSVFGAGGFAVSLIVALFWLIFFFTEKFRIAFLVAILFLLSCGFLSGFFGNNLEAMHRTLCSNNLKQLASGLHNYHETYKQLPPTYVADENGRALHSWRTLVLEFVDERARYQKYDFYEPWNSAQNSLLHSPIPPFVACSQDKPAFKGETSYVAVAGTGSTWTNQNATRLSGFTNGTNNTVMVIETHRSGIHWMEPREFSLDEAIRELSDPDLDGSGGHGRGGYFFDFGIGGHNVLMADGSVQFVYLLPEDAAKSFLLTGNYQLEDGYDFNSQVYRIRYGNIFRCILFLGLVLLPIYWVVARAKQKRNHSRARI
jgi:prepilin-type processing-associated H-X9-DG protein